jgi:hypothetical protein
MRTRAITFAFALVLSACDGGDDPEDAGRMDAGVRPDSGTAREDSGGETPDANVRPDTGPRVDSGGACVPPEGPFEEPGCNSANGIECDGDWTGRCGAPCDPDECCSPQEGDFECVPRLEDGSCPAADLWVDAASAEPFVSTRRFRDNSCALVEGCIGGPGERTLLRFDTWTPNTGGADMYLGRTPADGESTETYTWSACHGHHHFNTYAEYELLTEDGTCVAATGHKQAFCLLDFYQYPGTNPVGSHYDCGNQGIQMGWQDVYDSDLDCQWIDVTDVPPGNYTLRIRINLEHILNESDYSNNEALIPVTIP